MNTNGLTWKKCDFHLHTKKDKEFKYSGEKDRFISDYINKLKESNIEVAAITNHNKFDWDEFKALKQKANKNSISLFPGIELSVKEGKNGIHCLVIFKEEDWLILDKTPHNNKIQKFLDEIFKEEQVKIRNQHCNYDLSEVIEKLNTYQANYFIILAHVYQEKGFFNECGIPIIKSYGEKKWFKDKVIGLQKVTTKKGEHLELEKVMNKKLAHIECSDCKSIDDIDKNDLKSYIKLDDSTFQSVVFSFENPLERISYTNNHFNHPYITSVQFDGGIYDKKEILLSKELNSIIGIRGSGKSTLIELIRYGLEIESSKSDEEYKKKLLKYALGSGGKIIINIKNHENKEYKIMRTLEEKSKIYDEKGELLKQNINSLIKNPLYFGQKDLSLIDATSEIDLMDKLTANNINTYDEEIDLKKSY